VDGEHLSPEWVTKAFADDLARCRKELPDLPVITPHLLAGDDEAAAGAFAALVSDAANVAQGSAEYHGSVHEAG
jgi:hypothetical protein